MKNAYLVCVGLMLTALMSSCARDPNVASSSKDTSKSTSKSAGATKLHYELKNIQLDLPEGWYGLDFSKELDPQIQSWPVSAEAKKKFLELYIPFKSLDSMVFVGSKMPTEGTEFADNFNITVHAPETGDFLSNVRSRVKSTYGSYPGYKVTKQPQLVQVSDFPAAEFNLAVDKESKKLRVYSCIVNTPKVWVQLTVVCREVSWTSIQVDINKIKESFRFPQPGH